MIIIVEINDFYKIDNCIKKNILCYNVRKIEILVKLKLKI